MSLTALRERLNGALNQKGLDQPYVKATARARDKRAQAIEAVPDWEEQRDRAALARRAALEHLDPLLARFQERFNADGGVVHHAATAQEAREIVLAILRANEARKVIKGKSMVTEEIELNAALMERGVDVVETDLGEYLIQLAGQRPSHIVAPAMHLSRQDIGRLLADKLGVEYSDDPTRLTAIARQALRQRFLQADAGITGANFLLADTGQLVLLENEANLRMCITVPPLHIAVVGIEKVLASREDLGPLLTVLARSTTGQAMGAYTSLLSARGRVRRHVILLDGGRRVIHADPVRREVLACVRCGACLNACPVYERVGGHAYGSVYPGPIGSLLSPHNIGTTHGEELPFASSLCGACGEVCPVKIDLPELLRHGRERWVQRGRSQWTERLAWRIWSFVLRRPRLYRVAARLGRGVVRGLAWDDESSWGPLADWSKGRSLPAPPQHSFLDQWRERRE